MAPVLGQSSLALHDSQVRESPYPSEIRYEVKHTTQGQEKQLQLQIYMYKCMFTIHLIENRIFLIMFFSLLFLTSLYSLFSFIDMHLCYLRVACCTCMNKGFVCFLFVLSLRLTKLIYKLSLLSEHVYSRHCESQ